MKTSIFIFSLLLFTGLNVHAQKKGHGHKHDKVVVVRKPAPPKIVYRHGAPHIRTVVVPREAIVIKHRHYNYHYHNGYYYRPWGNSYRIIGPPLGIRIRVLPMGYFSWSVGPVMYYYYGGTYYRQIPHADEYEVIRPPIGSTVPSLPDDYNEVIRNGESLYEVNGILYRPIDTRDGRVFEIVGYMDYR